MGAAAVLAAATLGTTAVAAPVAARRTGPVVLGLGDSVMAGTHCGCSGIVAEYAAREQRHGRPRIRRVNLGSNGATTASLLRDLRSPTLLDRVRTARVVIIVVGANDLLPALATWEDGPCPSSCFGPAVDAMGVRLGEVLAAIQTARVGLADPGQVLVSDYWNVFQDGHQTSDVSGHAVVTWSRRVTRLANAAICQQSTAYGDRCIDTYRPFLQGDGDPSDLLAADGDHPNAKGVGVIVRRLAAATPKRTF